MKRYKIVSLFAILLFLFLILIWGFRNSLKNDDNIAYLSKVKNVSQYSDTDNIMNLEIINDFNIRLTEADKTWVRMWVEGYKNGKWTSPFVLKSITYGEHRTNKVAEGPLGFGMNNPKDNVFWYSYDISLPPQTIEDIINSGGVGTFTWHFAIGDEEVGLTSGETKVIGFYRQSGRMLNTYDYQDSNQATPFIFDDAVVLLLKIKVDKTY